MYLDMKVITLTIVFSVLIFVTYLVAHENGIRDGKRNYPIKEGTEFNPDYTIDLKPKGYWIIDGEGNESWVELGELEEWFLKDNI